MSPRTFYRLSLIIPWLIPLLTLPWVTMYMMLEIDAVILIYLAFGGFAYLFFATALFYWLGRQSAASSMRALTYKAPLLFIPVQLIFLLAWHYIGELSGHEYAVGWEGIPLFIATILVAGYFYVVMVDIIYYCFKRMGWIRSVSSDS
ncbi:MAG: hypothetical protein WBN81_10580 [Gammaproteobacteria bacterium]